mgnify:CR=1 FL=1
MLEHTTQPSIVCYVRSIVLVRSFIRILRNPYHLPQTISFNPSLTFVLSYGYYAIPTIYHIRFRSLHPSFSFVVSHPHTPRRGVRHMYVLCMSVAVAPCAGASDISLIKDLSRLPPRVDLDALLLTSYTTYTVLTSSVRPSY